MLYCKFIIVKLASQQRFSYSNSVYLYYWGVNMAKKKKKTVDYIDTVLIHNTELLWYEQNSIIHIDINNTDIINKITNTLFNVSKKSHITFNKFETTVWNYRDGTNSIKDIINILKKKYPHQTDSIYSKTLTFTHTLLINNFAVKK